MTYRFHGSIGYRNMIYINFLLLFQIVFNGGLLVITNRVRYFSANKARAILVSGR